MSRTYDLISSEGGRLTLRNEGIQFLNSLPNEVVVVTFISSTDETDPLGSVKLSLISTLGNSNFSQSNIRSGATLYLTNLRKENTGAVVLFMNIKSSNKHLLSLLFLSSSLFIFCVQGSLNENEIGKFPLITSLPTTIELQQKSNREATFIESAPKCIFYISNTNPNILNIFPKDYIDNELRKKSQTNINLIRDSIIKYFPDRDCVFEAQKNYNQLLINKICREMNPKTIRGKLFNGSSLALFIQNFCEMNNNGGNPNFDLIWSNLINNDLQYYKQIALNYYMTELQKINGADNEENIISKIYTAKINSIEKFNEIYNLNIDTFNNPEYKSWYMKVKSELEAKFSELENAKLSENSQQSTQICQTLLQKHYAIINQKINSGKYNGNNTDEYLKDYEQFLNGYKAEATGVNKLKCLIEFLEINKPVYLKCLVGSIEKDNQAKLQNANMKLEESKKRRKQQEEEYKNLNEKTEANNKRVEDINSQIERKKREIKNLNSEIDRVEEEIRKAQQ